MSRLAPDIPELQHVPEAARSLVYLAALNRAIRSPLTWLAGAIAVAFGIGIGATQGRALFGGFGAILGTAVGASASLWCFFKVILPWRARRALPLVTEQQDSRLLDQVRHADDSVRRMIDEYERRESGAVAETTDGRGPGKLP